VGVSLAGPSPRANVLVLCAGHGTRLGPLSGELPKPLLAVGDRPQLQHVLAHLEQQGLGRVLINTHHLPESFAGLRSQGAQLHISREPELRGTAGAIAFARARLEAPLVVWNADILARPALGPLLERAKREGICLLARAAPPDRQGTLGLDAAGRVVRLRGERFGTERRAADYVGILALGPELVSLAPEFGCLVGDVCLPWLRSGHSIPTLPYDGPWTDIGTVVDYHRVNMQWLDEHSARSYVAPGATVAANVSLERSLIHADACVVGTGRLQRCIVFPGARATAPLEDAIVLRRGGTVHVGDCPTES
jgi:mannose-1-phosphate guanylyltransferase